MPIVSVRDLDMTYQVPTREAGLQAALWSLVRRNYRAIHAVQDLSFELEAGEVVGFIGPNGAGKTTTLKILSGILYPTGGAVQVLGYLPWRREPAFLRLIAMVRGSRPIGGPGELTVLDSLRFQQLIYEVSDGAFKRNLAELIEMLDLASLLERQIRALSLGERMRAGLAMALLYRPQVMFLDEPTLGLDVTAVGMMRHFITQYARHTNATILLTSHYMADVETLCKRIILIDDGTLRYDGKLDALATKLSPYKILKVQVRDGETTWERFGDIVEASEGVVSLRVHRERVPAITAQLLAELPIVDLSVVDPPLEHVIDRVYREGLI